MPIFKDTFLTEKGYVAANKAASGQGSFTITRAVASSNGYKDFTDNGLRQLTSLENEVSGRIVSQNNVSSKKTKIATVYSNELVPEGYMANTVGLYAKDELGVEFLYAVTPSQVGQLIPEQSNNLFDGFNLDIYVIVGNVQNMKVELSPGGDASVEYVDKAVSQAKDDINDILKLKMNRNTDGTVPDSANFVNGIKKNGVDVPNMDDLSKQFDNATKVAKAASVTDNHDNSITINGGLFGAMQTVYNTDFDDIVNPGSYYVITGFRTDIHAPYVSGAFFVNVFADVRNGDTRARDTFQLAISTGFESTVFRKRSIGNWSAWENTNTLAAPNKAMKKGDSFDSYTSAGHYNMNGLNPLRDLASGLGLPDAPMWTDLIVIPNANAITQEINDNIGNRWSRVVGREWHNFVNADLTFYDKISVKRINLNNPDTNKYTFNNAYLEYDPVSHKGTFHGSIVAKSSGSGKDPIFNFNIESLSMNQVTYSYLNSQPMTVDTDASIKNVVGYANYSFGSGTTWNIEGATIVLGYDANLKPKIDVLDLPFGSDLKNLPKKDQLYYLGNSISVSNDVPSTFGLQRPLYVKQSAKYNLAYQDSGTIVIDRYGNTAQVTIPYGSWIKLGNNFDPSKDSTGWTANLVSKAKSDTDYLVSIKNNLS